MKILKPVAPAVGSFSRASPATFVGSNGLIQTAPANTRRFTYDPVNLNSVSELIEPLAAKNYFLTSEDLGSIYWQLVGSPTLALNSVTAPDGAASADKLVETNTTSLFQIAGGVSDESADFPAVGYHCSSVYLKYSGRDWATMIISPVGGGSSVQVWFNLLTGVVGTTGTSGVITAGPPTITPAGNGWYRCSISAKADPSAPFFSTFIGMAVSNGNYSAYPGDATKGMFIWGAQYEAGSVPSSYIKTANSVVARSADVNTSDVLSMNIQDAVVDPVFVSTNIYVLGERVTFASPVPKSYEALKGTLNSLATVSSSTPALVTWIGHGAANNDRVSFTGAGLPPSIAAGSVLYVNVQSANTFTVSATPGGAAIDGVGATGGSTPGRLTPAAVYGQNPSQLTSAWLDRGATNRWKLFDTSVQSQTTNPTSIDIKLKVSGTMNVVSLLNMVANSVRIQMFNSSGVSVYDRTTELKSRAGIVNWYNYFFNPIRLPVDLLVEDLPTYQNTTLQITLTVKSGNAAIGALLYGFSRDISLIKKGAEKGAKVGIQDYSVKTQDAFGNYTIVERSFNKRADFTVYLDNNELDDIQNLLASYRATPILYIGSAKYAATIVYGFYKTFDIDIAYDDFSACSLQLEGLT